MAGDNRDAVPWIGLTELGGFPQAPLRYGLPRVPPCSDGLSLPLM
jgi:hypothetical protein